MNGLAIHATHLPNAHTDGDAIVHFREADVVHMGDTFFNKRYPFMDVSSSGSVDDMIAVADHVLALAGPNTKIIPGHGPLATKADLEAYRAVLIAARDRVARLVGEGKSLDDIVAAKPLADFDGDWGVGFLNPAKFLAIVHSSVSR